MTTASSPPPTSTSTSPPAAKRVKTTTNTDTDTDTNATTDTTTTMAQNESAPPPPPVTAVDQSPPLLVKFLSERAREPVRGSAHAAGYDLFAAADATVPARGKALVDTDLAIAVPAGTYGRIAPRSGLAAKHFIDTGAGVIDADYRGPVKVLLFNHHADADFAVSQGDRVAQLVLERIYTPAVVCVAELDASVRGAGGFGSTGGFGGPAGSGSVTGV